MLDKKTKDKFNFLLEYNIKKGGNMNPMYSEEPTETNDVDDNEEVLAEEADEVSNEEFFGDGMEQAPEAKEEPKPETTEPEKELTQIEILSKLANVHSDKIESLFTYLEDLNLGMQEITNKTNEMETLKAELEQTKQTVKSLLPLTPLEQLENAVKVSGGVKVDDYWNNFLQRNGQDRTVQPTKDYYQPEKAREYTTKKSELGRMNDMDIKKTFYELNESNIPTGYDDPADDYEEEFYDSEGNIDPEGEYQYKTYIKSGKKVTELVKVKDGGDNYDPYEKTNESNKKDATNLSNY